MRKLLLRFVVSLVLVSSVSLAACAAPSTNAGIQKIKHVIIIFQENRTFDSYFGTYPGAEGIPMKNGVPTVSVTDPATGQAVKPYVDHSDVNDGGPHDAKDSAADTNGGKMDGFIGEAEGGKAVKTDVMGYHTERDIPNYWAYAKNFVLQDHMFESVHSWSLPSHLFLVSAWSADTTKDNDPMSCIGTLDPRNRTAKDPTPFAWTDLTYLLDKANVTWANYLDHGAAPEGVYGNPARGVGDDDGDAAAAAGSPGVPQIWNVLPGFTDVTQDKQLDNIQDLSQYYLAAKAGTLPGVSWMFPDASDSEHPPSKVSVGESYVTTIVNAAMQSPDWDSTAIFITWDDWGGFYDHVVPPSPDSLGYGIRVPALLISPYAKKGYIDHQTLSFDAYLKFIEDDFLSGQRLDPKNDGRPDSRPDVRESQPLLGNLANDFDFTQTQRPPVILPTSPKTTLTEK